MVSTLRPEGLYDPTATTGGADSSGSLGIARLVAGVSVAPRYTEDTIAIGTDALNPSAYVPSGIGSIAIGYRALASVTSGDTNVAIGPYALENVIASSNLVAIGSSALRANNTGTNNTAVGADALYRCTSGHDNVAIGGGAAQNITTGHSNTVLNLALFSDVTGTNHVAIGRLAMAEANGGDSNVAIGVEALYGNIAGNQVVDGTFPSSSNWKTSGNWTIASNKAQKLVDGVGALIAETGGTTPYIDYGVGASYQITYTVSDYTAGSVVCSFGGVSDVARSANGTYVFNVTPTQYGPGLTEALTLQFTPSNTARLSISNVSFIGFSNKDFSENVAIGVGALYQTARGGAGTGRSNTAIGFGAHRQHTVANNCVAIGSEALRQNGNGDSNTAVGSSALFSGNSGARNVAIGFSAGYYETGSDKLFIDNRTRANESDARAKALIYGVFDATTALQQLFFNAAQINMAYLPVYANNAAAVGGGLAVGRLYRTGGDPDTICVVH